MERCAIGVSIAILLTAASSYVLFVFHALICLFQCWQRLSSSGYVFSASLPPYLASAAITAIDILEENPKLITKLKSNIAMLWKGKLWSQCKFLQWNHMVEQRLHFSFCTKSGSVNCCLFVFFCEPLKQGFNVTFWVIQWMLQDCQKYQASQLQVIQSHQLFIWD